MKTIKTTVNINEIEPNSYQKRNFCQEELTALAEVIATRGKTEPILVRQIEGRYQIIAGVRRWKAALMAGVSEIDVEIVELTDVQAMQFALIDDLQYCTSADVVDKIEDLCKVFGLSREEAGEMLGYSREEILALAGIDENEQ